MTTAKLDPVAQGGRIRSASGTLTYAAQAAGSYSFDSALKLPIGANVVGATISTSTTTGTASIALGITGTTAKYKAAAAVTALTAANVAVPHAALLEPLTAEEEVIVTSASAALPTAGAGKALKVIVHYVVD